MEHAKSYRQLMIVTAASLLAGSTFLVYRFGIAHANGVPSDVPIGYSGRLTDNGAGVTGTRTIGVSLYAASAASTPLCQAASQSTQVTDGYFRRTFDATCNQTLLASATDPHVEVFVNGASVGGKVRIGAVPYAIESVNAQNGVPIGAVIDWWRPASSTALPPDGFKICDGSQVNDAASPFNGLNVPNLTDKFVRGVTAVGNIGAAAGSDTHMHTVDLPSHQHAIDHDHASFNTTSAGSHAHRALEYDAGTLSWLDGAGGNIATYSNGLNEGTGNAFFPLLTESGGSRIINTGTSTHAHAIDVPALPTNTLSGAHDPAAVTVSASNVPAYYGLLKIIRIK